MGGPKVSVIIPCYNLGQYLDEAVDSVFAQTFQDFEIVIVNDGSTDPETNRLLAEYRRPLTRVIAMEHRGLAAARNRGIAETTGRYICALDADDRLDPKFLEKTVRFLEDDPSVAFVSSWLRTFEQEEWLWRPEDCDLATLLGEDTVLTSALVRREALLAVGGYDERMPAQGDEDWDLWLSLVERGYRGRIIPEVLFYYRRRPGSLSTTCVQGETHLRLVRYLIEKHLDSYRKHLVEVLLRKETDAADLIRGNYDLERLLETRLGPEVQRRTEELERLGRKLESARQQPTRAGRSEQAQTGDRRPAEGMETALQRAQQEIVELRNSKSWRITAPLRRAYELLLRITRGPSGGVPDQ